jgi:uncharacterized membrane protein
VNAWTHRGRIREYVETAAWPIPVAYLAAAGVFGTVLPRLDRAVEDALPAQFGAGAAQALLTAFATGLITVMGFIISMVLAGLTFSGTTVSPRIVREMRRNTRIQHVFGLLLFSVVYAFLVLNRVAPPSDPGYVPDLAVWLVTPLLVLDVIALLILVREIGHALRLVEIIDTVHRRALQVLDRMYPDELGDDNDDVEPLKPRAAPAHTVCNRTASGVVASLDLPLLVHEATRLNTSFELACPIGSYMHRGAPLLHVADRRSDLDEERLQRAVTLADERTIDQDPLYALRLLVDIATRALSQAVNDPTTAVQTLDRIEDLLRLVATRRLDCGIIRDTEGRVRLVVALPGWGDYVAVALTEIRAYGATSIQVLRRLRAILDDLLRDSPPSRHPAVEHQLALLDQTIATCFPDPTERELALVSDRHGLGEPSASRGMRSVRAGRGLNAGGAADAPPSTPLDAIAPPSSVMPRGDRVPHVGADVGSRRSVPDSKIGGRP